jgi:hypothetical protein
VSLSDPNAFERAAVESWHDGADPHAEPVTRNSHGIENGPRVPRTGEGAHGVMGTAPGPEAIGAVQKVLLVDRLQHLAHGVLDKGRATFDFLGFTFYWARTRKGILGCIARHAVRA